MRIILDIDDNALALMLATNGINQGRDFTDWDFKSKLNVAIDDFIKKYD